MRPRSLALPVSQDGGPDGRRPSAGDTGRASPACAAPRHDSLYAYHLGCRCPEAASIKRRSNKRGRIARDRGTPLTVDATGTKRRLRALMALGWRRDDLAARLGVSGQNVTYHTSDDSPTVYRTTAVAVGRLYDQLADHQGPSRETARRAKAKGWLVPLWWDEDTIDDPTYVPVTVERDEQTAANRDARQQRRAEVERLTALGLSAAQIATRLGLKHDRQVVRDRQWLREQQREAL